MPPPESGIVFPRLPPSNEDILASKNFPEPAGTTEKPRQTNNVELSSQKPTHLVPPVTDSNSNTNDLNRENQTDKVFIYNPMSPPSPTSETTKNDENNQYEPVSSNEIGNSKAEGKIDRTRVTSNTKENEDDSNSNYTIIILTVVPIVIVFGLVPMIVAAIWLLRKRNKLNKRPTKELVSIIW